MLELLFWACMGLLVYYYFGYPVLLGVCSYFKKSHEHGDFYPFVSLLIPAYNEEDYIAAKIENCLALDYPRDRLEVLLFNDGSSDSTGETMRSATAGKSNLTSFLSHERQGKLNALNFLVEKAKGEVLVFSDANVMLDNNALQELVKHYGDKTVGGVCGNLVMESDEADRNNGEAVYKRYDQKLKEGESSLGCVAGAEGAVYSIRKALYGFFPGNMINDDLLISTEVLRRGYKLLFEPLAVGREQVLQDDGDGFRRRARIAAGNYQALRWLGPLLNPFNGIITAWVFFSHKVLRWVAPFLLILIYIINFLLLHTGYFFLVLFILQNILYFLAVIAALLKRKRKKPVPFLVVPHFFVTMNLAMLAGFIKYLRGSQNVYWEKFR